MRWSIQLLFLIVLAAAFFIFLLYAAMPSMGLFFASSGSTSTFMGDSKLVYQKTAEPKIYVGVIRTTGLEEEAALELQIPYSRFQITDIAQSSEKYSTRDSNNQGYVLAFENGTAEQSMNEYIGRCVKLDAYEMLSVSSEKRSKLAGRSIVIPKSVTETSFQSCSPYPEVISLTSAQKKRKFTVRGIVENQIRTAIDIPYDYKIKLAPPFQGSYNAKSETGSFAQMPIIPGNSQVWRKIEENIGKEVELVTYLKYGEEDMKYLLVESVNR